MLKVTGLKGLFQCFAVGVIGLSLSACDDVTKWNQSDTGSSSSSSASSIATYALSGTVTGNTGTLTLYNNSAYVCEIPYVGASSASSSSGKLCSATPTTSTSNGAFSVNLPAGYAYSVTFIGPQGQVCAVAPSTTYAISGTVKSGTLTANVPGVVITCTSSLSLKGTVSGLVGTSLTLSNNGVNSPTTITANTGNNVTTLSAAVTASATTISVTSASALPVGTTILVDSEQMIITAVGTTLTVTRGANGTVVADHASGKGVSSLLFTFFKATSGAYSVAIPTQPPGQTCTFGGSASSVSGTQATSDITNIAVTCVQNLYGLTVNISGLSSSDIGPGSLLKLSLNGAASELVPSSNTSTYSTQAKVSYQSAYSIAVTQQPANKTCTFTGGGTSLSGQMGQASQAALTCVPNTYKVGGAVSGLGVGQSLPLTIANTSAPEVHLSSLDALNGYFEFSSALPAGTYVVAVATQPSGKDCSVFNPNVTVTNSNITSVLVECSNTVVTIEGTNSPGAVLTAFGSNASTGNTITPSGTAFKMYAKIGDSVYISASKVGYNCSVTGGVTGVPAQITSNVTNVTVSCTAQSVTITGANPSQATVTISGSVNNPSSSSAISPSFTVKYAETLQISAVSNVANESCSVSSPIFTVNSLTPASPAFTVTCSAEQWTIGGTVNGLDTVLFTSLTLLNNGGDSLAINDNGDFVFANPVAGGSPYAVTIDPTSVTTGQDCTVTGGDNGDGSGTATADVAGITVTCVYQQFVVSGAVTGNVGEVTLTNNGGGDQLVALGGGAFAFAPQDYNTAYNVVASQPTDETCLVFNGSGTVTANVTVTVTCAATTYTIGGTISNLTGSVTLAAYTGDPTPTVINANGDFTLTSTRTKLQAYAVAVTAQPAGYTCTVTGGDPVTNNGSGTVGTDNVTSLVVDCATLVPLTLGVNLSGVPVGTSTTPLASYLTIQDHNGHTRVVVYGSGNPVTGTGNITFGTPAAWANQLPVTNNSLVVNDSKLYLVNYGGGVQCTVGTTAPTGTTVGLPQVIAATEQPATPVGTSLTPCVTTVNLTYVGPYTDATAATYTPFYWTIGQSYTLTITSNPTNATCKLNGTNGINEPYASTFGGANVFVPVTCEYAGATLSGTISGYGTPQTTVVGGTTVQAVGTWTTASADMTLASDPGGIGSGYQVWVESTAGSGTYLATGMGIGGGAVTAVYVGSPYSGGTTVPLSSTQATNTPYTPGMAAANINVRFIGGGTNVYQGMKLTVTGTAVDGTTINYTTTDAIAASATTFTIPSTYLFKAGTSYTVTISTPPIYAAGSERTCTVYNGSGTVPSGVASVPAINNLVIECLLNVANTRLMYGSSAGVSTTNLLTAPTAPTTSTAVAYTAVLYPTIKSIAMGHISTYGFVVDATSGASRLDVLALNATSGAVTAATATAPAVNTLTLGNNPYQAATLSGYVFATNTADDTLTAATLGGNGTMTALANTTIGSGTTARQPRGLAIHPSGQYLYVAASGTNEVYAYTIGMTAQTALGTAVATGTTPYNIAVDPSGNYAYVTNYGAGTISKYRVCQLTTSSCTRGALIGLGTETLLTPSPLYIAADTGSLLVVTEEGLVYHYAINQSTGALTSTNSVNAGVGVTGITLASSRNVFYVTTTGGIKPYSYSTSGIGAAGTAVGGSTAAAAYR